MADDAPLVVIVEDDEDLALLMDAALRRAGFRVQVCATGAAARTAFDQDDVALVLLDVRLPDADGLELLDVITSEPAGASWPVLVVSGECDPEHVVHALERGATDYVRKPFLLDELLARVAAALRPGFRQRDLMLRMRAVEINAHVDPVTGGPNRAHLVERLQREHLRARALGHGLGVLLVDVDGFKEVNDRWGHAAGDRTLAELNGLLRSHLRVEDTFGRWGGDEFLAVLPNVDQDALELVGHRLLEASRAFAAERRGGTSISCGGAVGVHTALPSVPKLIDLADLALYEAKENGRDACHVVVAASG